MADSKFDFYEVVIVSTDREILSEINNCEGYITGMAQNEQTRRWGYAVSVYSDNGYVWHIMEDELQHTGRKQIKEETCTNEFIRVRVDPETGEGEIVEGAEE